MKTNHQEAGVVELGTYKENRHAAILHEQLALQRLKRLSEKERERRERARAALIFARAWLKPIWKALKWLFTPVVPVRREGPHLPPVPLSDADRGQRYLQRYF